MRTPIIMSYRRNDTSALLAQMLTLARELKR
jgi:hypothetical protein